MITLREAALQPRPRRPRIGSLQPRRDEAARVSLSPLSSLSTLTRAHTHSQSLSELSSLLKEKEQSHTPREAPLDNE